jgi:hypothetical protein
MVPVSFNLNNHAIMLFDPVKNRFYFSIHNVKVLKGERKFISMDLNDPVETRKGLVAIVAILTKLEPQVWGWSPSRCEIPYLMGLLSQYAVPFGVLWQNPAPGRGVTYHKEFMEWVWNAMPFYGNINSIPANPLEHLTAMIDWSLNLTESKEFAKAMKHNTHFVALEDDNDHFARLSNVLHTLADIACEEIEDIE